MQSIFPVSLLAKGYTHNSLAETIVDGSSPKGKLVLVFKFLDDLCCLLLSSIFARSMILSTSITFVSSFLLFFWPFRDIYLIENHVQSL